MLLENLGTDELDGTISAETVENSNMVTLMADAPTAEEARAILDAAMTVYPQVARFVLGSIEFHLLDDIETPTEPYNVWSVPKIVLVGGVGGLFLASMIVCLMALFNNTVKTTEDMEKITSVEYLGALPTVHQKARKNSNAARYISALDPAAHTDSGRASGRWTPGCAPRCRNTRQRHCWSPAAPQGRAAPLWPSIWRSSWHRAANGSFWWIWTCAGRRMQNCLAAAAA